ncbi:hypothetical protein DRB89_41780 [Streptomyces sp. ICC4]|nr:hypothetical protein DRB89_41780 [Streptomyces sp. ICC4]
METVPAPATATQPVRACQRTWSGVAVDVEGPKRAVVPSGPVTSRGRASSSAYRFNRKVAAPSSAKVPVVDRLDPGVRGGSM